MMPRSPALWMLAVLLCAACKRSDRMDGTAIILVMDGVRLEDSLGDDPSSATGEPPQELMPQLWSQLLPEGARASQAWSLGATTTTPAHAAIISGRRQPLATVSADADVGLYRPQLPSLFEAVRAQLGSTEDEVLLVANTGLIRPVERSLWPGAQGASWVWVGDDSEDPAPDDRLVLARLQEELDETPTKLALVNMHQLDRSGHYGGSSDYLDDLGRVDEPIAELWAWLQDHRDYRDDTTLVLMADHGRHDASDDDPHWRHHGDSCNGCRRVPALVLGPLAVAGVDGDEPVLLTDIAPTVAAILGVELPWAEGLVMEGLLDVPGPITNRSGVADMAMADEGVAEIRYGTDPWHRSALWVDGVRLSSPEALGVEAPAMASEGQQAWVCFRELTLDPEGAETPWLARCLESDDGGVSWQDLEPPVERVGPLWRPVLHSGSDGSLLAAWVDNRAGTTDGGAVGADGELHLVVSRYDGGWSSGWLEAGLSYPTDIAAVPSDAGLLVAVGAGPQGSGAQHARDIWLGSVDVGVTEPLWTAPRSTGLGQQLGFEGAWRLELPALSVDDMGAVGLAAVAQSDAGGHGVMARSDDEGQHWTDATVVDLPYPPFPQLPPVWVDGRAVWACVDVDNDEAWFCSAGFDEPPSCVSADSPRVSRMAADQGLHAIIDLGLGAWERREIHD